MFKFLKRMVRLNQTGSSARKDVEAVGRLQRACARVAVDNALHAPGPRFSSAPAVGDSNHQALSNETHPELFLDQTLPNDTHPELALEKPSLVAGEKGNESAPALTFLQRIASWFEASPVFPGDRRGGRRYLFGQRHPHLKIVVEPSKWPTTVKDISTSGVSFVLGVRHAPGSSLRLTIIDKSRGIHWPVQAQVVRIVLLQGGQWYTCCAFDGLLDDKEVKALL